LVVDQPQTTFSLGALSRLMDFGAAVVVCGRNHLPSGLLLPLSMHTEVVWRLDSQIHVSKPTCKQLWKQLVVAKIEAQAGNVEADAPARRRLLELAKSVKSGDSSNLEAQAAKVYWSAWLAGLPLPPGAEGQGEAVRFHRDVDGKDPVNAMLNYGYAVVRAAIGRALVAAGLHPALGLHHSNRSNAFCLADDLLEPLRPLVDRIVRELHQQGRDQLDRGAKAALLSVLTTTVRIADQAGPLLVALHRLVASLVDCYEGRATRLLIPRCSEEER
jgi:CRISPR-associated protein Cas1